MFPENFVYSKSVLVRGERFCPPHRWWEADERVGGGAARRPVQAGSAAALPEVSHPGERGRLFRARRAAWDPPGSESAEQGLAWVWGGGGHGRGRDRLLDRGRWPHGDRRPLVQTQ